MKRVAVGFAGVLHEPHWFAADPDAFEVSQESMGRGLALEPSTLDPPGSADIHRAGGANGRIFRDRRRSAHLGADPLGSHCWRTRNYFRWSSWTGGSADDLMTYRPEDEQPSVFSSRGPAADDAGGVQLDRATALARIPFGGPEPAAEGASKLTTFSTITAHSFCRWRNGTVASSPHSVESSRS